MPGGELCSIKDACLMLQGFQVGVLMKGDSELKVLPLHEVCGEWSSEGRECGYAGKTQIPDQPGLLLARQLSAGPSLWYKAGHWSEVLLRATALSH